MKEQASGEDRERKDQDAAPAQDIPDRAPYGNDLPGLKETGDRLSALVKRIEGPCIMALDGSWGGAGKTTFLDMWEKSVKDGFLLVRFNAWETDFGYDPLLVIAEEIGKGFPGTDLESLTGMVSGHRISSYGKRKQAIPAFRDFLAERENLIQACLPDR